MHDPSTQPAIPTGCWQYLRSLGPGLVLALTWLGAGDLVDSAVAGGNYGYSLMWAMVIALFVRFVFVSIIAKYQLCNQYGESLMAGLKRVHRFLPVVVGLIALLFGHFYGSYLIKGVGETTATLFGVGAPWTWSFLWVTVATALVFRGVMDVSRSSVYQAVAAWCLFSPLIWSLPGTPGFVALTVIANAAAVVVLPLLCGSLCYITARTAFIGAAYRNRWWENGLLAALFVLSVWGAYQSVLAIGAAGIGPP